MSFHDLMIRFKNLDSYRRAEQKQILQQLMFEFYLRKGYIPPPLQALYIVIDFAPRGIKFNPYHDPDNGEFTFAPGGPADDKPDDDDTETPAPASTKPSGPGIFGLPQQPERATPVSDDHNSDEDGYPTSKISSESDARQLVANSNGQYIGKDSQCASLVHELAPDLPPTPKWLPGDQVQGNTDIPAGTPIATFNFQGQEGTNGYGPPSDQTGVSGQSHAGIYLGQDSNGLSILNQWKGSNGPRISYIPWNLWNGNPNEGGSRFYTIAYEVF